MKTKYLNPSSSPSSDDCSSEAKRKAPQKRKKKNKRKKDLRPFQYLNTAPDQFPTDSDESIVLPSKRAKRKSSPKSKEREQYELRPFESELDSDAISDEDILRGVISTVGADNPPARKKVPTRTAKQKAHDKLQKVVDTTDSDPGASSEDEFDVNKELSLLHGDERLAQQKGKHQIRRFSLDNNKGVVLSRTPAKKIFSTSPSANKESTSLSGKHSREVSSSGSSSDDSSLGVAIASAVHPRMPKPVSVQIPTGKQSLQMDVTDQPISWTVKWVEVWKIRLNYKNIDVLLSLENQLARFSSLYKVQKDDFVAFKPDEQWHERPLIGRVVTASKDSVNIIWYMGRYSTKWAVWTVGKGDDKKIQSETISRKRVLKTGFRLTSTDKLPIKVMKELRRLYAKIDTQAS